MLASRVDYISDSSEADLLAEVASGNQTAYRQLFDKHIGFVYNAVLRILGNRQDAEDVTQDVFFTLWRKARSIRGESKLSTWLYRVAINKAINARKRRGSYADPRVVTSFDDPGNQNIPASANAQPDRQQQMKSAKLELAELLAGLPEKQREVYLLHKMEGLSYKEIAEELNLTLPAVESAMHRAKVKLQELMVKKFRKQRK
jgi:RNA polymerase sigma-70 factor (ECF subfamily)